MRAVADRDHRDAGALGRRWPTPRAAVVFDAHLGGYPRLPARNRIPHGAPAAAFTCPRTARTTWTAGHAVPALVEEGGPGHQRRQRATGRWSCWPTSPASMAHRTRLRNLAAGVRGGDRPGDRQLRRADPVLRGVPLPRRRLRRVLQGVAPDGMDGARRRGFLRLGHRRRPRRRRRCSLGDVDASDGRRIPRVKEHESSPGWSPRTAGERSGPRWPPAAPRPARRGTGSEKLGEVATEFDSVHSVERALHTGSINAIIPAARLRPHLIEAVERGIRRAR